MRVQLRVMVARCFMVAICGVVASCVVVAGAQAAPITILVGDNDGFGAGIPDGGDGSIITNFETGFDAFDFRSVDEANATDGAHATDFYYLFFPTTEAPLSPFNPIVVGDPADPRASTSADISFLFSGELTSASLTIDFLDWQSDGYITANVNGSPHELGSPGSFSESFVRTYSLTPSQLAAANDAEQVILSLVLAAEFPSANEVPNGDLVAFDFFRLDGELADVAPPPPAVPEPTGFLLMLTGMGCVALACKPRGH